MKMLMISYNSAADSDVMNVLEKCGLEGYTKWTGVQGKGKASGLHLASEVWPGENSVIFCAAEDKEAAELLECVKRLREKIGKLGVKAFAWNLQ